MSYSFFYYKTIYIKLLNGELFSIEVNEFDEPATIIQKICEYEIEGNKLEDIYRFREHRMKFFIQRKYGEYREDLESIGNINKSFIDDDDVICIISNPPPDPVKLNFNDHSFFKITDDKDDKDEKDSNYINYFLIKNIDSAYDALDNIYLNNYNSSAPLFFDLNIDATYDNKNDMKILYDIIQKLIEYIPFQDDTKDVLFRSRGLDIGETLSKLLINHFKDVSHLSLKTLGLDILNNYFINELFSIINNKSLYIKNLYINFLCFEDNTIYLSRKMIYNNSIDLENIQNIFIFMTRYHSYEINSPDFFLKMIGSRNNTVYINYRYSRNEETNNRRKKSKEWMYINSDNISPDINIYKYISLGD